MHDWELLFDTNRMLNIAERTVSVPVLRRSYQYVQPSDPAGPGNLRPSVAARLASGASSYYCPITRPLPLSSAIGKYQIVQTPWQKKQQV